MDKQVKVFNFQKIPFVKEWGSWAVFIYACSSGLIVGLQTRPWQTGNDYSVRTLAVIIGLVFLLNSKAAFAFFMRGGREQKRAFRLASLFLFDRAWLADPIFDRRDQYTPCSVPFSCSLSDLCCQRQGALSPCRIERFCTFNTFRAHRLFCDYR